MKGIRKDVVVDRRVESRTMGPEQEPETTVTMMSPNIPTRPFDHPAAWTAADLGGKDDFAFDLTDRHIAAFEAAVKHNMPLGREQTPEDIGKAVAFLASDDAKNITGQALNVDGGMRMN